MKFIRTLTAVAASGGLAMIGLMTAGTASAGTYTSGSWTLIAPSTDTYAAQVQQPINSDGSSVFSNKSRTIPVKYKVTDTQKFAFESVINGGSGVTPGPDTAYSVASYTMPSGLTVKDITGLVADFAWTYGENHGGGFRWQVVTPSGTIMVDYGDAAASLQGGTAGSGVNMVNSTENRCESTQVGGIMYTPWSYVADNFGGLQVTRVDLVVDGGWGTGPGGTSDQIPGLADATVSYTGGSSTFTMPTAATTQTNSAAAWISLSKMSGSTPQQPIDESTITSTQGDTGGQFRQVDGMYIYNLPVSNLSDPSATYQVGISSHSDGSNPAGTVRFGLK